MAEVIYTRKETDEEVNNIAVQDGQLIYTKDGHVFMDFGVNRIPMQNTPDDEVSNTSTNSVQNKVIKEYVDNSISVIDNKIHNGTILWENPDDTISFSSQTITLNSDDYNIILWFFKRKTDQNIIVNTVFTIKGIGGMAIGVDSDSGTMRRGFDYIDDTHYEFSSCNKPSGLSNDTLIPMYAVGFETDLFN